MKMMMIQVFLAAYAVLPYIAWGLIALYGIVAILGRNRIRRELQED